MKLGIFSRAGQLANEDQAYDFGNYVQADGVNDKGTLASAIDFDNNSPWALSFWAKGSASSNQTNMIFSKTMNTIMIRLSMFDIIIFNL